MGARNDSFSTPASSSAAHSSPEILGRSTGEAFEDPRAPTRRRAAVEAEFVSGALGDSSVELFTSTDSEDRGGVVLRFRVRDGSSALVPTARLLPDGVDLHIGGDAEAEAMLDALEELLRRARPARRDTTRSIRIELPDAFELGDFRYVVTKATPQRTVGNAYVAEKAGEGATFVVVHYTLENLGKETETVLTDDFRVIDGQGREFRPSSAANTALAMSGGKDLLVSEVQPGLKRAMATVFEVPEAAAKQGIKLVIPEKGLLGSDKVEIALRLGE